MVIAEATVVVEGLRLAGPVVRRPHGEVVEGFVGLAFVEGRAAAVRCGMAR